MIDKKLAEKLKSGKVSNYYKNKVKHDKIDGASYGKGRCSECRRFTYLRLMLIKQTNLWYCGYCWQPAMYAAKVNKLSVQIVFDDDGWERGYGGLKTKYGSEGGKKLSRDNAALDYWGKLRQKDVKQRSILFGNSGARNPVPKVKRSRFANVGIGKSEKKKLYYVGGKDKYGNERPSKR